MRAFSHNVPPGVCSIVASGGISWVFDQNASTIAAYREVNLADREETVRSSAELAHHWQAWQKRARHDIQSATGRLATIRPIFVWEPTKFQSFHPGGLQLPPRLEDQLFDHNPAIRRAIDWLRVGTGKF